jgi:hypothetical protein
MPPAANSRLECAGRAFPNWEKFHPPARIIQLKLLQNCPSFDILELVSGTI